VLRVEKPLLEEFARDTDLDFARWAATILKDHYQDSSTLMHIEAAQQKPFDGVDSALEALLSRKTWEYEKAYHFLQNAGPAAVPGLVRVMREHPDREVREHCGYVLSSIFREKKIHDRALVPLLLSLLDRPDSTSQGIYLLQFYGDQEVVRAALKKQVSADPSVLRMWASPWGKTDMAYVKTFLDSKDPAVALEAAYVLAVHGDFVGHDLAVHYLQSLPTSVTAPSMRSKEIGTHREAVAVLQFSGTTADIPILEPFTRAGSWDLDAAHSAIDDIQYRAVPEDKKIAWLENRFTELGSNGLYSKLETSLKEKEFVGFLFKVVQSAKPNPKAQELAKQKLFNEGWIDPKSYRDDPKTYRLRSTPLYRTPEEKAAYYKEQLEKVGH
jgi:hypothetical protein